ncbi:P-type DNA transfer protein VirB5 [Caulobacter rhizosphaerae]|jgi:type IV secretion system protein VirB5|nr:P-type DNA transfer protein VirB5 [Caulobacter rhizosphaerae]
MNRHRAAAVAAAILQFTACVETARAQVMVYDAHSYASLVRQAATAMDQLDALRRQVDQTKALYDSFNAPSQIGAIAGLLDAPALRAVVPDLDLYLAASRGDFQALGQVGVRAKAHREESRLYTPRGGDQGDEDLDQNGDRIARDLSMAEHVADVAAQRRNGLEHLTTALAKAPNVRTVMDIQARLAAEQAMIGADQMRLHGLAMAQAAEGRLRVQREEERAKAERAARMRLYQEAF